MSSTVIQHPISFRTNSSSTDAPHQCNPNVSEDYDFAQDLPHRDRETRRGSPMFDLGNPRHIGTQFEKSGPAMYLR